MSSPTLDPTRGTSSGSRLILPERSNAGAFTPYQGSVIEGFWPSIMSFLPEARGIAEALRSNDNLLTPSPLQIALFAELGAFHHDLAQAEFGRGKAQLASALSYAIVHNVDTLIDTGGLGTVDQVRVVEAVQQLVSSGVSAELPEGAQGIADLALRLHATMRSATHADRFFDIFVGLGNAAVMQARGTFTSGQVLARELGGSYMLLPAASVQAFDGQIPESVLTATRLLGEGVQLKDDALDFERDQAAGTQTSAILLGGPSASRIQAELRFEQALEALDPYHRSRFEVLVQLFQGPPSTLSNSKV